MSYTVIITEEIAANVAVTTQNYPITIEYNATNIGNGSTYGNANVEGLLASGVLTGNIITSGDGEFGNVTASGFVFASGNVVGTNVIGNGQYLTNVPGANVSGTVANATYATTSGSASTATTAGTANIALVANSVAGANVTGVVAQAAQANTANIATVAYSVAAANVVGTVANAAYATAAGSATTATTANVALVANSVAGANVSGAVAQATQAATANVANSVSGANVSGAVAQATQADTANVALVAYSVNAANVSGTVANATYSDTSGTATSATTAGTVTTNAQPNITSVGTLAGLTATGNVNLGNVVVNADNIRNVNAVNLSTTPGPQRITIGSGYDGNFGSNVDPISISRGGTLAVADKYNITNTDSNMAQRLVTSSLYADMGGATLTSNSRRLQPLQGALYIGNGTQTVSSGPVFATATGIGGFVGAGNITIGANKVDMGGPTTVGHMAGAQFSIIVGGDATVGNAVGALSAIQNFTNVSSTTNSAIGYISQFTSSLTSTTAPTNVYGFYMPGTTATHGVSNTNNWRRADNYYFLVNEDDVAQNRLGSLRRYHEFNGVSATTSGSLTIDKTAGQVQQVNLAGNVTSVAFSNFVTSASDGTNTDEQCDTVTIAFNQGATGGYGVTFPTGSEYKYAGNVRALQSTAANSVSLVSVSALRLSGTTTYLITVSPGFVS